MKDTTPSGNSSAHAPESDLNYCPGRNEGRIYNGWQESKHRERKRRTLRKGTGKPITKEERDRDRHNIFYVTKHNPAIQKTDFRRIEFLMQSWADECTFNTPRRKVLKYLVSKVDHSPDKITYGSTHKYTPTQARIARDLGMSENAVKKHIQRLRSDGLIDRHLHRTPVIINGKTTWRSRVVGYWLCCGSMWEYAKSLKQRYGLVDTSVTGSLTPRSYGLVDTSVTGSLTPKPKEPKITQNYNPAKSSKTPKTNGKHGKPIREMPHLRKLAKEKGYNLHANGDVEAVLDMLQKKKCYDTKAVDNALFAPKQAYQLINDNWRMNGKLLAGILCDMFD